RATFRTADVVGLDTLRHVTENLYEGVPEDESRERFRTPDVLARLVDEKRLGQKSGAGFHKKEGGAILSLDPETMAYAAPKESDLDVSAFQRAGDLPARLNALYEDDGRAGRFFRATTLDLLGYAARRIPEIADSPADIDKAVEWGFGWEMGPFRTWDALGFARVRDRMKDDGIALPGWVDDVPETGLYREAAGEREVWVPEAGAYRPDPKPADEWGLALIQRDERKTLWKNDEAALLDLGDGVALYEFRSKANSLGQQVMEGLVTAIEKV